MKAPGVVLALLLPAAVGWAQEPTNFALADNGGVVAGPRNSSHSAARPPVANDGRFDGYCWAYLDVPLLVSFATPQTINTVELVLHHENDAWYRFRVEVSLDGTTWTTVAERTTGWPRGWQTLSFPPVACSQLRVTFTDTSIPARSYHVVEIAAYLLPDPSQPSPLRREWERRREEDRQRRDDILLSFLGPNARMTPEQLREVLATPTGRPIVRDLDGDGKPDCADFVDTDPRHTVRPMAVRVLDDDHDMGADGQGDVDSDCFIADWKGDGRIERAVDYWDEDGDGDPDRMDIYYCAAPGQWHTDAVEVVVIRDIGDDNRMWYTRNYEYDQPGCQWLSDFNGDEAFCMFHYVESARRYEPFLEAPFVHRDLDGDGAAETTIQFIGSGQTLQTIRYSFDADNDCDAQNPRDYDFSLNCVGPVTVPPETMRVETLRNGQVTGPYLDWSHAWEVAEAAAWRSCRLCWDEIDHNVNPADRVEREHERWEGVGGYDMREGNKRWETDADGSGRMRLYYWPADRRLHLLGAESGFIAVDWDHDYQTDARISYADEDRDGFFDLWSYDADADGTAEHTIRPPQLVPIIVGAGDDGRCHLVSQYPSLVSRYRAWLDEALVADHTLLAVLRRLAGEQTVPAAERWWLEVRPREYYAAEKLVASREATRYYWDIIREELFLRVRERRQTEAWWPGFREAYEAGDYIRAAQLAPD